MGTIYAPCFKDFLKGLKPGLIFLDMKNSREKEGNFTTFKSLLVFGEKIVFKKAEEGTKIEQISRPNII